MILRILGASFVALGLGVFSEGAKADQSFMCADGRLLQLSSSDVERLRYIDGCVAAALGETLRPTPLPVQRPSDVTGSITGQGLKGAQVVEPARSGIGAIAQASTDYRRVRIINAQRGSQSYFTHSR